MKRIGETPGKFKSRNTCQHNGRVFHFSQKDKKLVVTEAILGDKAEFVTVETRVDCKTDDDSRIACCSFGKHILVMSGPYDVFAASVDVDEGRLSSSTLHITTLIVEGDKDWHYYPYLCQTLESQALLYFHYKNRMWYCDIAGTTLTMKKCKTVMPASDGFTTVPIRLPDGKLLVAGSAPNSTDITLITTDGEPTFEKVGDIPGVARRLAPIALITNRFVLGFGGGDGNAYTFDDLWIFDLQTRQSSQVKKEGEWHPAGYLVPLVVQDDILYLVGGPNTTFIYSLLFPSLAGLIVDKEVRLAFCKTFGLPATPSAVYTRKSCRFLPSFSL